MKKEKKTVNTIAAIAWAADQVGLSYGRFAAALDKKAKIKIYTEYADFLAKREKEEEKQVAAMQAIAKKMPPQDHGSRFNPALINSTVDTGATLLRY